MPPEARPPPPAPSPWESDEVLPLADAPGSGGDAWGRGQADRADPPPLRGGEHAEPGAAAAGVWGRDRHVRLGVSHRSDDPARYRTFAIRADHDAAAGDWVARVEEEDANEQLGSWAPPAGALGRAFPTPAACLGAAVAAVVAAVDRDAADPD